MDIDPEVFEPTAAQIGRRAYAAAAGKRYDEAIRLYSQGIDSIGDRRSEFHSMFRTRRGLAYELKGDRTRALDDHCMSVAIAMSWQSERISEIRIQQITVPNATVVPMPLFQQAGILRRIPGASIAPLTISVPSGHDYLVKLRSEKTNREELLIYVQAGSTHKALVPFGTYRITGAHGAVWYGTKHLFGEDTKYFRLQRKEGDDLYRFWQSGNIAKGFVVQFQKVEAGNLLTPEIPADHF